MEPHRLVIGSERVEVISEGWSDGRPRSSTKMTALSELRVLPIPLADDVRPGDSLADKLLLALKHLKLSPRTGDI